jgi:hypothetical protein
LPRPRKRAWDAAHEPGVARGQTFVSVERRRIIRAMDERSRPTAEERPTAIGADVIYWSPAERMPLDLFSYFREAGRCRDDRRFLAAIAMASTAVELILNRDRRLRGVKGFRQVSGWRTLNKRNLRLALEHGLPVGTILSAGEDLGSNLPLAFVELRNKVAHGQIGYLVRDLSDYDGGAERLAAEQHKKMHDFIIAWFNTAPDVQEGHIREHQWPR